MAVIPDFQTGPFAVTHRRKGMPCWSRTATGNILPSRFVILDIAKQGRVKQAVSSLSTLYGISQAELRGSPYNPSLHAIETKAAADGESLFVFGPNSVDVLLEYGAQVAIGDRLTSDASGRGITATSAGDWILAVAQQSGNVGFIGQVTVFEPRKLKGQGGVLLTEAGSVLTTESGSPIQT